MYIIFCQLHVVPVIKDWGQGISSSGGNIYHKYCRLILIVQYWMTAYAINYIQMKVKSILIFLNQNNLNTLKQMAIVCKLNTHIYRNPDPGHLCGLVIWLLTTEYTCQEYNTATSD